MQFYKMHGIGNDFIFIDESYLQNLNKNQIEDIVTRISNRKTGIGCDQVIFYSDKKDSYAMSIYNNDGSYATACGNASRCFAKLIFDQDKRNKLQKIVVSISDRIIECKKNLYKKDFFEINMGIAQFEGDWIPQKNQLVDFFKKFNLDEQNSACVNVGNDHLVIILDDISENEINLFGKNLGKNDIFPNGVNVNFVTIKNQELLLTTYERGSGITNACGSGACASFATANKLGFVENKCKVIMKSGELELEIDEKENIIMKGGASMIASGVYFYEG